MVNIGTSKEQRKPPYEEGGNTTMQTVQLNQITMMINMI